MRKVSLLVGVFALVALASCGEKKNEVISTMVEGKSSAEVAEMVVEKYQSVEFIESYNNQDFKLDLTGNCSTKSVIMGQSTNIYYGIEAGATYNHEKGVRGNFNVKAGELSLASADLEYDVDTDNMYLQATEKEKTDSVCITGVKKFIASNIETELPNYVPTEMPSTEKIAAVLEQYKDVLSFDVTEDELEITFTTTADMNSKIEDYLDKQLKLEGMGTYSGTGINVTISFNEDLYLTGIDASIATKITVSEAQATIDFSASMSLDIKYGTFNYTSIEGKDSFETIKAEDYFGSLYY